MYHVNHPDVARIRAVVNGIPLGVMSVPGGPPAWYRPGRTMHANPTPLHAYTRRLMASHQRGSSFKPQALVHAVSPQRRRRRKFLNPTFVDYMLGAFGVRGMPAYRSTRYR